MILRFFWLLYIITALAIIFFLILPLAAIFLVIAIPLILLGVIVA